MGGRGSENFRKSVTWFIYDPQDVKTIAYVRIENGLNRLYNIVIMFRIIFQIWF